ncbi:FAD-dependent oxidoreductase [Microlunatus antarcticus]|uniref:2,4-dienoyl-CoA reductase-like NADH-dependent reductase (Old Yellow Enzyme family) n=1 Tax=Microlunatus antarcticus TaxID=53388 RepID=A0A7W5JY36_9ACTN|nr:FAD-dependent oxidoreductase [Microlunatus antarcticus]MBB3328241.1 2,4-dienoyl-CoA reductase-like NADH-dependent reductase (Old Yellow Enzyme family) [Microlunatus antarcticus]
MTVHDTASGSFAGSAGALRWPTLFSPFRLRGKTVRNRITSTPHSTGWGHDGLLTQAEVDYHVRKAAGGVGLVMTFGSASVDPESAASYGSISLWDPRNDALLRQLADRVHAHGALTMAQMTHMGRRGNSWHSGVALKAASDLPEGVHREVPAVLSEAEIAVLVDRFGHSARRLMELGWDGAEVTSHGGHLIEQFYDPYVNDRTDRYGGSFENRLRFGREVLAAVRAWTSEDFLVGFRMSAYHGLLEGAGMTDAELVEVAQGMTANGAVDLLSVSGGTGYTVRSSSVFVPGDELGENVNGPHAGRLRRATGVATLVAGRILDADHAEEALVRDGVDLVAMTRALIADPDLPRTYAAGRTPRPCISLNEGCIGRLYQGRPMWCSVNPGIREPEVDLGLDPGTGAVGPTQHRRVVVIGGGVAGAEAAFRAAERGSSVTLFEQGDRIGGRAELAGRRPGRERWGLYLDWLVERLAETGVDVRLRTSPTVDDVLALEPDSVVIASGSAPRWPSWVTGAPSTVVDADTVVARTPSPEEAGAVALVVDDEGGFVAPTAAEALAAAGWTVRLATSLTSVAAEVDPTQVWFVRRRLKLAGVELVDSVGPDHDGTSWSLVDLESDLRRPAGRVDLVVLAGVRRSADALSAELAAAAPDLEIVKVGDALAPRHLLDAAAEGARAGAAWGKPEVSALAPATVGAG